jgi:hypothetical protein
MRKPVSLLELSCQERLICDGEALLAERFETGEGSGSPPPPPVFSGKNTPWLALK